MAGTAHLATVARHRDHRRGAVVVSVDDHVDPEVWAQVMHLALDCRAVIVPARSDEHDAAAAAISHSPHLLAEALAATAGEVPLAFALAAIVPTAPASRPPRRTWSGPCARPTRPS